MSGFLISRFLYFKSKTEKIFIFVLHVCTILTYALKKLIHGDRFNISLTGEAFFNTWTSDL